MNNIKPIENKELHLHQHNHLTININYSKPKPKQLIKLIQIKCLVCGSYLKVKPGTKFGSNSCFMKYQEFKHNRFLYNQKILQEDTKKQIKKWWEL